MNQSQIIAAFVRGCYRRPTWLLPAIIAGPHAWRHDRCWQAWRDRRRTEAIAVLAGMGSRHDTDHPRCPLYLPGLD